MPAGLLASLAGAACGPCGRSAPCEGSRSSLPYGSAPGGISSGPACSFPGRLCNVLPFRQPPLPRLCRHPPLEQAKTLHLCLPPLARLLPAAAPLSSHGSMAPVRLSCVLLLPCRGSSPIRFPLPGLSGAAPPSRLSKGKRLCAQPAFFQPSRHLCAKKNDFVKKNANTALLPSSLPDNSACSPPERPLKTGAKNRKNQEITDFFRQSALTSPAKHVSVFSIAAGLQAVLGITCGVSVTFERVFFHVQVHLCWEPPLGRY